MKEKKRKLSREVMGTADRAAGQSQMKLSFLELRGLFND